MRIVPLQEIQSIVSIPEAIEAVRAGFIAFSEGRVGQPSPLQMLFNDADGNLFGDCHGKAAQASGLPYFVIKVATGFYNNASLGLPVNNGLVIVLSAETGVPIAILQDNGWLTQIRTAAAGALAAELMPIKANANANPNAILGVIGTGTQAELQARVICEHLGFANVAVYGRTQDKAKRLCNNLRQYNLNAVPMESAHAVCHASDVVVTTTPSTTPVIYLTDLPNSFHIIAVGADSPGKIEIDPAVFSQVNTIVTDSHQQCLSHGEFGAAVRAGFVADNADSSLCELLAKKSTGDKVMFSQTSLVDLTGMGVQDLALATLVVDALSLPL